MARHFHKHKLTEFIGDLEQWDCKAKYVCTCGDIRIECADQRERLAEIERLSCSMCGGLHIGISVPDGCIKSLKKEIDEMKEKFSQIGKSFKVFDGD
jgi:hypothetical protein